MKRLLGISSLFFVAMTSSMQSELRFQEEEDGMIVGGSLFLIAQQKRQAMAATKIVGNVKGPKKESQDKASGQNK